MTDPLGAAVIRALDGLQGYEPEPLLELANFHLRRSEESLTEDELVEMVTTSNLDDPVRIRFHIQLSRWDGVDDEPWAHTPDGALTQAGSPARRAHVIGLLGLGNDSAARIGEAFPVHGLDTVVIAEEPADWTPWYTDDRANERTFYWDAYKGVLAQKMDAYAVDRLDHATREVVRRLADPSRPQPYQSKGLVVGHVQSGKTANFTGVIAKAVDAGYRLVIVLTGTIEILRAQTQRRLDMELVGVENILGGIDPASTDLLAEVDYAGDGDRDWVDGRFVKHGVRPRDVGAPEIRRLTRLKWDYRALKQGIATLDFRVGNELADATKPLYDPVNLHGTDVRVAVVKKNKKALEDLVKDLSRIHARAGEIPTLIIDDEADQASVNTLRDKRASKEEARERTRINSLIAELLGQLKRAQYVGYTATPFANVFIDPDDSEDLFPKDFIVSLEPPAAYMGGRDFHDLHLAPEDARTVKNSNELAFVRDLTADPDDDATRDAELLRAIDSYVLAGAVKLWRDDVEGKSRFRHHTMLVHEAVEQKKHEELARSVAATWRRAGYSQSHGLRRLHDLWRDDVLPVSEARADGLPVPRDFKELSPWIGPAVDRISSGSSAIAVVNGNKESDYAQPDLNFDTRDVWKILVGGAKLSRGFTVEGLTVSYYTRRTTAADTLMQMGRWFGYRAGYKDLVRLYLGRSVPAPRGTTVDLYRTFEAIIRDEEDFRRELRAFQGRDAQGNPLLRPRDVPPMVFQSVPWLKPTGTNRMYNAVLSFQGEGGQVRDFFQQPPRDAKVNEDHFAAVGPLLAAAQETGSFANDSRNLYAARYGIVGAEALLSVIQQFRWQNDDVIQPTLTFYRKAMAEGTLQDWVVIVPLLEGAAVAKRHVVDHQDTFHVLKRERRPERNWAFSGSSPRQRPSMRIVSGGQPPSDGDPIASGLHRDHRGAFLLTFAADIGAGRGPKDLRDPAPAGDIATLFSLAFPRSAAPSPRVGFSVRRQGGGPIVPVTGT
ncbi:Z1 domain-containing protein [Actinotalea sp. Marseille-Q4924]|uniref:Z1 domain-containing protein n=1 Tax=Actinotalea sp. Marseille-Q4924 TaxID=2866571 RepID=UPI001CE3C2EF|nr:Z1 domain-containing protein [Actinotalea sp. Marseille-Q4924]